MKVHTTRRALLMSVLSLLLCVSMLIGTTFAWFTDSVTSGRNTIMSGNLDIELEYYTGSKWETVNGATELFSDELWEPGHTQVVYLKLSNQGTLALKYGLNVNVTSEKAGYNVNDEIFYLSDYIEFGVIKDVNGETGAYATRDAARNAVVTGTPLSSGYSASGEMEPSADAEYMALVVYMPEIVGNEANYKTGTAAPEIDLGINLYATQLASEKDSFGSDYDATAPWTGNVGTVPEAENGVITISTAEELAALAASVNNKNTYQGVEIRLGADIDLNNVAWTPIGMRGTNFNGSFNGNGYTIYNLKATGTDGVGLIGFAGNAAHIENVKIVNAEVSGTHWVGTVLGYGYLAANCLKDCYVENSIVTCTPVLQANGTYDDGNQAGVIAGMAINGNITGNTAKNSTVIGYRDLGGIVGCAQSENRNITVENNTVENVEIVKAGVLGTYPDKDANVGDIVGRKSEGTYKVTVGTNNGTATIDTTDAIVIYTVDDLYTFAASVNGGNTYKGKTVLLGADIDLNNAAWTPIGNATYSFQGTFDGQEHTISNLNVSMAGKSNAGLFGYTTVGEIKNLTVNNATVTGRLNVGVVAGTPYTSKYTNIKVTGHVEVNGMAYVGGVGGKNVYANWTNITVDVDNTSYVKADSVENGTAYRTYVGGVIGFMGEGEHTVSNVTSNIDVIGSSADIGGITGIAHYDNTFVNCSSSGDVSVIAAGDSIDAEEIGGIAGVWHNDRNVTFDGCSYTGKLSANITEGVDLSDNIITGKAYKATGTGKLIIIGYAYIGNVKYDTVAAAVAAAKDGDTISLTAGTFYEALNLQGKALTVQGVGKGVTVIAGPTDYTTTNIPKQTWAGWGQDANVYALISANKAVTIKDLTVNGNPEEISEVAEFRHQGDCAFVGIHVQSANATIENVDIKNIKPVNVTGNDHHNFGLYITSAIGDNATYTVTYKNGTVSDVNRGGIYCWGNKYTLNFENVTVIGPGNIDNPNGTLIPAAGSDKYIYAFAPFYVESSATYTGVVVKDSYRVSWGGANWTWWGDNNWATNTPQGVTCINCGIAD